MIPINTTKISVKRIPFDPARDPYDAAPAAEVIASGIRAHISTSTGYEVVAGGSQEIVSLRLSCDMTDITHLDIILDEATGEEYGVTWARVRHGFGLDHIEAGLRQVEGVISKPAQRIR